jgi:uncharacterized membrane protein YbhN (UPF0104 family)
MPAVQPFFDPEYSPRNICLGESTIESEINDRPTPNEARNGEGVAAPKSISWIKLLKLTIKLIVCVLVAVGIAYSFWKAYKEFDARDFNLRELRIGWLLASCGFYVVGMFCDCLFWLLVLQQMKQRVGFWKATSAFFLGQLGKYVPGKAMVVVIRAGMIKSETVSVPVATLSVFVETLTLMAVGGFVAAAILLMIAREHFGLVALAIALMVGSGLPTIPPIFRRMVRLLRLVRLSPQIEVAINRLDYRFMIKGWLISLGTWTFVGLSLFAILKSLPGSPIEAQEIPICIGCAALASVAGFISLIPGGLGVRELVIMSLLVEPVGAVRATISAIVLRFGWLVTDLLVSFILYVVHRLVERR